MVIPSPKQIEQEVAGQQWPQARQDLLAVLKEKPESAKAWYFLAQVDTHTGNLVEAKDALQHADKIDPLHSYVGDAKVYRDLSNKLYVEQTAPVKAVVQTYPVQDQHAAVAVPVKPNTNDNQVADWLINGLIIAVVFAILWIWMSNRRKHQRALDRMREIEEEQAELRSRFQAKVQERQNAANNFSDSTRNSSVGPGTYRPVTTPPPAPAYFSSSASPSAAQPVVVNSGSNNGLLEGLLIGEMLGSNHTPPAPAPSPAPAPAPRYSYDSGSSSGWGNSSSSNSSSSSGWDSSSSGSNWDGGGSSSSFDSGSSSGGGSDW